MVLRKRFGDVEGWSGSRQGVGGELRGFHSSPMRHGGAEAVAVESKRRWDGEILCEVQIELGELFPFLAWTCGCMVMLLSEIWLQEERRENQCKTLSKIIALHCKCNVLILK